MQKVTASIIILFIGGRYCTNTQSITICINYPNRWCVGELMTLSLLLGGQLILPLVSAWLIAQVVEDTSLPAGEVQVKVGLVVVALEVHL